MAAAAAVFGARQARGEVVLVVGGATPADPPSGEAIDDAVRERLRVGPADGPRQIAEMLGEELGVPRRTVYEAVLRLRGEKEVSPDR